MNCILEANHSAQKLLEIISENFSYFRDESIYNGQKSNIYTALLCIVKINEKFDVSIF